MNDPSQKKTKKKLRHTKLVLPDEHPEEPAKKREHQGGARIQRARSAKQADNNTTDLVSPATPPAKDATPRDKTQKLSPEELTESQDESDDLPANAVLMPRQNTRVLELRKKKRKRRLLSLAVVLALIFSLWLYASGNYQYVLMLARDTFDTVRVMLMRGDGYPIEYSVPGYVASEGMGSGGFTSLGETDLAVFSAYGEELRRTQHGFANPGVSAGDTRVCVYSRGGTGYLVESRSDTLLRRNTDEDILFVEMSDNGSLMVVTSSRYRSNIQVFSSLYRDEADYSWDLIDEKPVDGVFSQNNTDFALACLSSEDGALGTSIYLLNSSQDEAQALIRADDASLLMMDYLSQSRLLVVYDSYAAVYNMSGEETARYDYAGRTLLRADVGAGRVAFVFGSQGREDYDVVLLQDSLQTIFEVASEGKGEVEVLSVNEGVFVLVGQKVEAFDLNGRLVQSREFFEKPLGLVQAREALLLTVSSAESLDEMFSPQNSA